MTIRSLVKTLPDLAKVGVVLTHKPGPEKSLAIEILQKGGWSLDIGTTQTQSYLGISKDIISNRRFELDIGAGITTSKQGYIGTHISF